MLLVCWLNCHCSVSNVYVGLMLAAVTTSSCIAVSLVWSSRIIHCLMTVSWLPGDLASLQYCINHSHIHSYFDTLSLLAVLISCFFAWISFPDSISWIGKVYTYWYLFVKLTVNAVDCRCLVLRELNVAQNESCCSLYPSLTRLQCLSEMEMIASLLFTWVLMH